jgi:hypothetical protein
VNGIDPIFPGNASPAGPTDNPGGTLVAGGGVATETGRLNTALLPVKDQGSDNTVAGAIPSSGGGGASRTNELAVPRLQRRQERLRRAVPCYSNDDLDRMFRHAERAKRAA